MTIKIEHHFGALFVLQILSSLFAKKFRALFVCKKISANFFVSNEGNRKLPIMGVLEDWDFFKKEIFLFMLRMLRVCIVRKTKKLLLWGLKRTASLYGGKFFFCLGNM